MPDYNGLDAPIYSNGKWHIIARVNITVNESTRQAIIQLRNIGVNFDRGSNFTVHIDGSFGNTPIKLDIPASGNDNFTGTIFYYNNDNNVIAQQIILFDNNGILNGSMNISLRGYNTNVYYKRGTKNIPVSCYLNKTINSSDTGNIRSAYKDPQAPTISISGSSTKDSNGFLCFNEGSTITLSATGQSNLSSNESTLISYRASLSSSGFTECLLSDSVSGTNGSRKSVSVVNKNFAYKLSSKSDDNYVYITAQRYHNGTGKYSPNSNIVRFRHRVKPVTRFNNVKLYVMYDGSTNYVEVKYNDVLVVSKGITKFKFTYSYPKGEYGIVSGCRIRLWANGKLKRTLYRASSTSAEINASSLNLKPLTKYTFYLDPYYDGNLYYNGVKQYGLMTPTNSFSISTDLSSCPLTINYPLNNSMIMSKDEVNKYGTRILFTLPNDPDAKYISNYKFSDIEVVINSYSCRYKFNPELFSTSLENNSKAIFMLPSNITLAPASIILISVHKEINGIKSGISRSTLSFDTNHININNYFYTDLKSKFSNNYKILYDDISTIIEVINYELKAYGLNTYSIGSDRNAIIERSLFTNLYSDLSKIYNLINTWQGNELINENLKINNMIPLSQNEIISVEETTDNGANLFITLVENLKLFL